MVDLDMTYKELLAEKLKETEGRQTYTATEVKDTLLDLWLQLDADEAAKASV